jgi:hypothetical protein
MIILERTHFFKLYLVQINCGNSILRSILTNLMINDNEKTFYRKLESQIPCSAKTSFSTKPSYEAR